MNTWNIQGTLFTEAEARRDAVIERQHDKQVRNGFYGDVIKQLAEMPKEVTGEMIRLHCEPLGIQPNHHNGWGSVVMNLVRSGHLEDTGKMARMRSPRSHARKTTVYRNNRCVSL